MWERYLTEVIMRYVTEVIMRHLSGALPMLSTSPSRPLATLLCCVGLMAFDVQQPALGPLPVAPRSRCWAADKSTDQTVVRVVEGLHEMIPLEQVDGLRRDATMTALIALAVSACHLGGAVQPPVPCCSPRAVHRGQVLTSASCPAVAYATHRSEADRAVLPRAPLQLRRELS
jgi:hypothetical protein